MKNQYHFSTLSDLASSEQHADSLIQPNIAKLQEDINFLKNRIERVKRLQTPSSSVLNTYQSMLDSRVSVLQWLQEKNEPSSEGLTPGKVGLTP